MDVKFSAENELLGTRLRGNQIEILSPTRSQVGIAGISQSKSKSDEQKKSLFERVLIRNTRYNEQLRQQIRDIQEVKQKRHHHLFYLLTELKADILGLNKSKNVEAFYLKRNNIYPRRSGCDPHIVSTDLARARYRVHLIETRRLSERARLERNLQIRNSIPIDAEEDTKKERSQADSNAILSDIIPDTMLPPIEKACRSVALQELKSQIFASSHAEGKMQDESQKLPPIRKKPIFFPNLNLYELKSMKMKKTVSQNSKHVNYRVNRFLDRLERDRELLYCGVVTPNIEEETESRNDDRLGVKERWHRLVNIIIQRLRDRRIIIREGFRRFVVERWREYKNLPNDESITSVDLPAFFRMMGQEKEKEKQLFNDVISEIKNQQEKGIFK